MGFALGFLPWVLYWALIGNVPFRVAAVLVLVVAIAVQVLGRLRRQPWRSLEVGSLAVFALLAVAAFVVDDDVLARWMQPLSNLGIFLVALGGLAVGRPFVREYAAASVDDRTARTDGFATITRDMTVLWVGVFAAMTVVSAIPPVVDGAATLRDDDDLLSILCFWVLPYVFLAVGGLASGLFPPWFEKRSALVDQRETAEAPHPAAQRPSPPDVAAAPLALEVPAVSRHDEPFPVVVRGLPAGAAVHVAVGGDDLFGRASRAAAAFTAPATGVLDLSVAAPDDGDWSDPPTTPRRRDALRRARRHAGALRAAVGAVAGDGAGRVGDVESGRSPTPRSGARSSGWRVRPTRGGCRSPSVLRASGACWCSRRARARRRLARRRVLRRLGGRVRVAGRPGRAAGGAWVRRARRCWISEADAAAAIASVPLERFADAVRLLADHPEVDGGRVVAMAVSRGAEGVLAAATSRPVADLPGPRPGQPEQPLLAGHRGRRRDPGHPVLDTRRAGRSVASGAQRRADGPARAQRLARRPRPGPPPTNAPAAASRLSAGLAHGTVGELAAERFGGPLLLLSGSEDAVWPSGRWPRWSGAPRERGRPACPVRGHRHLVRLAVLPTDAQWTGGIALGGDRAAQAAARRAAITEVTEFLSAVTAAAPTASLRSRDGVSSFS